VIERGWIAFADGRIAEFGEGDAPGGSEDAGGDLIMPGLIELHTDHLEAHYVPRPKVFWNPIAAVVSYDGQLATSGITTVLDSLRVWREDGAEDVDGGRACWPRRSPRRVTPTCCASDHFLHLRCEIPMPNVVEEMPGAGRTAGCAADVADGSHAGAAPVSRRGQAARLLSRQGRRHDRRRTRCVVRTALCLSEGAMREPIAREVVAMAQSHEIPLASHDDTTDENVTDAIRDRVSVAEFPTTIEAARGLHQAGIGILMGAPNVVRGGSHSGNIAAVDLAREGLLDILSSDYVPSSLLMGALQLPDRVPAIDLAAAIRTVTKRRRKRSALIRPRRDRDRQACRSDPGACRPRRSRGAQRVAGRTSRGVTEARP
jgi:alpha-D-ribose 1-methylphosphonate 5-triphosphate diphosphatase